MCLADYIFLFLEIINKIDYYEIYRNSIINNCLTG